MSIIYIRPSHTHVVAVALYFSDGSAEIGVTFTGTEGDCEDYIHTHQGVTYKGDKTVVKILAYTMTREHWRATLEEA